MINMFLHGCSDHQDQLVQPRSQGLSSLPPLVVGRKTLVAAGHVTTCDTNYSTGVESTNNFCRSQLAEAKQKVIE